MTTIITCPSHVDAALVQLARAQRAIAQCKTAMEAKQISDIAEAARVYLERTNASDETVNRAAEIRTLAERQMGAFLKQAPKAVGGNPNLTGPRDGPVERPATLSEIGITKNQSSTAQQLASIPEQEFRERLALTKASGERITAKKIIRGEFSPAAIAAGEEAEADSENLWILKSRWNRTSKRDQAAFLTWAQTRSVATVTTGGSS